MIKTNTLFDIRFGPAGSDETGPYYITLKRECTVREFIEYWLKNYSNEWGYFGIYDGDSIFGHPNCEYSKGQINTYPIPDEFLGKKIEKVYGSGGWSRSDILFKINRNGE